MNKLKLAKMCYMDENELNKNYFPVKWQIKEGKSDIE